MTIEELEKEITFHLETYLNTHYNELYNYSASTDDFIEIYATNKQEKGDKSCLIKVGINQPSEEIYIPGIFIPADMEYNEIAKRMIYIIYTIGKKYDYDVFVVQPNDGFRDELLKSGALETDEDDTLQIAESTNLF